MSKVALLKCETYEIEELYKQLKEAFKLIGGLAFIQGKTILLKPNLLAPVKPEKAVTTHPEFLKAVIRIMKENNPKEIYLGDSPGIGTQDNIYKATGMAKIIEEEGIKTANFRDKIELRVEEGRLVKQFTLAKVVSEVDYIFSLPKLKTHGMTYFTGSIKNLFGTVPGLLKPKFHYKFPDKGDFSQMLVDLNLALKPVMGIMDAVIGMEGNGPNSGTPRAIGAIIVSKDLLALDSTACNLVGINPKEILPLVKASETGIGEIENFEILGDSLEKLKLKDFKQITKEIGILDVLPLPKFLQKILRETLVPKPKFIHKKCIMCKECIKVCPAEPKALVEENNKIKIDRKKCIRCFCCQEMCPVGAIVSKKIVL